MLDYLLSDVQAIKKQLDFIQNNFVRFSNTFSPQNFGKKVSGEGAPLSKKKIDKSHFSNKVTCEEIFIVTATEEISLGF